MPKTFPGIGWLNLSKCSWRGGPYLRIDSELHTKHFTYISHGKQIIRFVAYDCF